MIDINACKTAINGIKTKINNCFSSCNAKGSTYNQTSNTLSELKKKIDAIPSDSSGTPSESIRAGAFSGFNVAWPELISPSDVRNEFTINMGSVGVTFKSLVCYDDENDGYFSISKISDGYCIISAHVFNKYNDGEAYGVLDIDGSAKSFRASYTINGNSITFIRADFPNANFVGSDMGGFRSLPSQVAIGNAGYYDAYPLRKITVTV